MSYGKRGFTRDEEDRVILIYIYILATTPLEASMDTWKGERKSLKKNFGIFFVVASSLWRVVVLIDNYKSFLYL